MRNLILVSAVALATALSFGVSARAATVMVHHAHHCVVKTVKHRDHHGRVVIPKTRVCR